MNKRNEDIKKIYTSIENEYILLKDFERGDCYGDSHRHLPLSPHQFTTVVNRFYDYVGELEENLFSFEELSRIDDHRRAINRDSQNRDIENMIKIIMYGVNDVMKIINSKNLL